MNITRDAVRTNMAAMLSQGRLAGPCPFSRHNEEQLYPVTGVESGFTHAPPEGEPFPTRRAARSFGLVDASLVGGARRPPCPPFFFPAKAPATSKTVFRRVQQARSAQKTFWRVKAGWVSGWRLFGRHRRSDAESSSSRGFCGLPPPVGFDLICVRLVLGMPPSSTPPPCTCEWRLRWCLAETRRC